MHDNLRPHASTAVARHRSRSPWPLIALLCSLAGSAACADADDGHDDALGENDHKAHLCVVHIQTTDTQTGEFEMCWTRTFPAHTAQECEDDKRATAKDYLAIGGKVVDKCSDDNVAGSCKWTVASIAGVDVSYDYRFYAPLECLHVELFCDSVEAEVECSDI